MYQEGLTTQQGCSHCLVSLLFCQLKSKVNTREERQQASLLHLYYYARRQHYNQEHSRNMIVTLLNQAMETKLEEIRQQQQRLGKATIGSG